MPGLRRLHRGIAFGVAHFAHADNVRMEPQGDRKQILVARKEAMKKELDEKGLIKAEDVDERALVSYGMYPKVFEDFLKHGQEYGYIMRMGSHVFFNGLALGEVNKINIEDGKTLVIRYLGLGDRHDDGTRTVNFELNGMRREVIVPDKNAEVKGKKIVMADPEDKSQIGASIPGMVTKINVKVGDRVEENQVVAVVEAMKMETSVVARMAGVVEKIDVEQNSSVKAGELLMTIKPE